jgi:spermidine/putrescine-binding protein
MPNNFKTILRGTTFSTTVRNQIAARWPVLLLLVVVLGAAACKPKQPTLTLLVWEGYADPSFIGAFEESHHCKVHGHQR